MVNINERIRFTDYASKTQRLDYSKLAVNWKNDNEIVSFLQMYFSLSIGNSPVTNWHNIIIRVSFYHNGFMVKIKAFSLFYNGLFDKTTNKTTDKQKGSGTRFFKCQ